MAYRKALELAVIFIENHLESELKVEDVARAAGYSYYHLNRQFVAILGESVGSYIQKRRLAKATKALLYTEQKVIDISEDCGFQSPEAFSRAFKVIYQVSPQVYRKNRIHTFFSNKERLDHGRLDHIIHNITVHPKIVELSEINVAGIRGKTSLKDNQLKQLWERVCGSFQQIPNRIPNGRAFGICEACHENSLYNMSDEVFFNEVVGVEVYSFDGLPESFVKKVLPGGRYAVFTHQGTLQRLQQMFDYIWGTWSLNTKEVLDGREDFELYDERFMGYENPDSKLDLYIPIR